MEERHMTEGKRLLKEKNTAEVNGGVKDERRKIFPCPFCGSAKTEEEDTVQMADLSIPRRRCEKCGRLFPVTEPLP